jgi:hypothetical protein
VLVLRLQNLDHPSTLNGLLMSNYTPEDLLEYHYKELNAEQYQALTEELKQNWALRQKLAVIREAAKRLDKSIEKPRQEVVASILKYAGRKQDAIVS